MCDVAQKITVSNIASVGFLSNDGKPIFTSLGEDNIFDDVGFGASSVKMSKNGNVIVAGSFDANPNDATKTTNRPGVHIYLKKAGVKNGCNTVQDWWQHYQSILFDGSENLLQVTEVAISDDGSSIVALDGFSTPNKIWVFEELDRCTPNARWSLQQTLINSDDEFDWQTLTLDDKHKRLVLRKFRKATTGSELDENVFCVYDRIRAQQKCSNVTQPKDGFKFTPIEQTFTFSQSGDCLTYIFALSNDGQTLVFANCVNNVFHIEQWQFNCDEGVFEQVSSFPLAAQSKPVVEDVKFGGACSEKLFILTHIGNNDATVEVHSRVPAPSARCCAAANQKSCCSGAALRKFSADTLVTVLTNISATSSTAYLPSLIGDPIDGDSFLLAQVLGCANGRTVPLQKQIFLRLWRQTVNDPPRWYQTMLIDGDPIARCYKSQNFDMLSFDAKCNRYCVPLNQRTVAITFSTFSGVYVSDPDGCFYLNAQFSPASTEAIYYRVEGDTLYTKFDKSLLKQKIVLNNKACAAKTIELVIIDEASDPNKNPELIAQTVSLPLRTCFSALCFEKAC